MVVVAVAVGVVVGVGVVVVVGVAVVVGVGVVVVVAVAVGVVVVVAVAVGIIMYKICRPSVIRRRQAKVKGTHLAMGLLKRLDMEKQGYVKKYGEWHKATKPPQEAKWKKKDSD